jgi:hypothetical protein
VNTFIRRALLVAGISAASPGAAAWAADPPANAADMTTTPSTAHKHRKHARSVDDAKADDTAVNKRDRSDAELTADQQKNNRSDLQLTAEIRRAIMKDKTLSTNAHNVKIIVRDGLVTLKGPVASQAEKDKVERNALDVLGAGGSEKLTSEIGIAP